MSKILDLAKRDMQRFTGGADWGTAITFVNFAGATKTIKGLALRRHLSVDTEGQVYSSRFSHISFSEALLAADSGLSIRTNGAVKLEGWKVRWTDSTGTEKTYQVKNAAPDETLGLICCILEDVKTS